MDIYKVVQIIESTPEIYNMLKYCPYDILKRWQIKKYEKDSIILNQGEIYDYFYIIVDGIADVFVMSENGKRYSQSIYNKGNFIGELEIFNRVPFSCSIEAITDLTVLQLKREYFLSWIEIDRNISEHITKSLCSEFYRLSKKAAQDTLYPLKQRLCRYLLDSIDKNINKKYDIAINVKKDKLSSQLAVTERSINRVLHSLKEKSIINVYSNTIIIKDLDKLENEEKISRID